MGVLENARDLERYCQNCRHGVGDLPSAMHLLQPRQSPPLAFAERAEISWNDFDMIERGVKSVGTVPPDVRQSARRWCRFSGFLSIGVGGLALSGWQFDLASLRSVLPGFVAMKANTALGLVFAGTALVLLRPAQSAGLRNLSRSLALVTMALGLATLAEYVWGLDLGLDQLLYQEPIGAIGTLAPGRMAPASALNFVFIGTSLLLAGTTKYVPTSQRLAIIAGLVGLLPLISYAYGAKSLYGIGTLAVLAIHTSLAFVVLSLGIIFAHPDQGIVSTALARTTGGWLVRRMVPVAIFVPLVLGWLRIMGERMGVFESALGVALMVLALMSLLTTTLWWAAATLTRIDAVRSRAEDEAHTNAEQLRAALYAIGDGVLTTDATGLVTRLNPAAEKLTGWSESEAQGKPHTEILKLVNETTLAHVESPVKRVLADRQPVGLASLSALVAKNGDLRPIADSGAPILGANGQIRGVVLVLRDLTGERASQSAIRQAEGNFVASFHGSPVAMSITSATTGEYVDVNDVYLRDSGFSRNEVIGHTSEELRVFVDPSARKRLVEAVLASGHVYNIEIPIRLKSGEVRTCLLSTSITQVRGEPHLLSSILDISARKRAEEDLRRALLESQRLLKVADESRQALLSMMEGQRLEASRRRDLEVQLSQSQRMESVGRLAGGVAHDFNNLISVILNYTAFAMRELNQTHRIHADLSEVQKAASRAATLTHQLLAFSRKQVLQPVPLNLNHIVTGVKAMLRRLLPEDIELTQSLAPNLGMVSADPGQMEQVLMNLIVNARDAMPNGGNITIETSNVEVVEGDPSRHADIKAGEYVRLVVTDSGCGMDEPTKARLFEPFFTTKEPGKGTGLGLATVYGIVAQSDGTIRVQSTLGHGSAFILYLPQTGLTLTTASRAPKAVRDSGGTETVLVVEDEAALRNAAQRVLEASGYSVLAAGDGQEALSASEQYAGDIHLLVTDVVMPRMNGRQLADALLKSRPHLMVLFMSGYTDDAIVHHGVLDAGIHFIGKPFAAADFTSKVRDVLDGRVADAATEVSSGAHATSGETPATMDAAAWLALPADLVKSLRKAVISARYDDGAEILSKIGAASPSVAALLERRLDEFDYDGIVDLLTRHWKEGDNDRVS